MDMHDGYRFGRGGKGRERGREGERE